MIDNYKILLKLPKNNTAEVLNIFSYNQSTIFPFIKEYYWTQLYGSN